MPLHSPIAALADEIFRRRVHAEAPPTLLLGAGFSAAAGAPSFAEIADRVMSRAAPDAPAGPEDGTADAFGGYLEGLDRFDRNSLALQMTGGVPVPQFVQEVALLARDGFFRTIVTLNFDALVERALDSAGLVAERDYVVSDLFDDELDVTAPHLVVVKAYGGAALRTPALEYALDEPVVVVGAAGDRSLVNALACSGGTLWWVASEPPSLEARAAYQRAGRKLRVVDGDAGDPDRFFGELSLLLQQMPSVNVVRTPGKAAMRLRESGLLKARGAGGPAGSVPADFGAAVTAALGSIGGTSPPDDDDEDDFERRLLRMRMQRCRDAVRRLERQGGGMGIDATLDRQLAYHREELVGLEARLRTIDKTKEQLLTLLGEIKASSERAGDAETARFLDSLVDTVDSEYRRDQPNQDIVGATLGAVGILADRAGVDAQLLHRLSAFAPGTGRGLG